jgi:hypothetical protein
MGRLKAHSARTIMRGDAAHMAINANSLMGGSSWSATRVETCHTRPGNAIHS